MFLLDYDGIIIINTTISPCNSIKYLKYSSNLMFVSWIFSKYLWYNLISVTYSADNPNAIGKSSEMYNYLEFIKWNIKAFA